MKYILLAALLCIFLSGCYTRKKATKQVNLAAVTFPDILAKKARDLFPCVTKGGDTIWVSDSTEYKDVMQMINDENLKLYQAKDSLDKALKEAKADTVCYTIVEMYKAALEKRDKQIEIFAYQLAHIPPVKITQTIHDTTVDNAAVKACEFDKSKLIVLLENETKESDDWHSKAKNRFYTILGMGAVIGVGGYFMIAGFFKRRALKKLKSV